MPRPIADLLVSIGGVSDHEPHQRLATYREKRDFSLTPEPSGTTEESDAPSLPVDGDEGRFVVQRHRARRTHYDLRLEINGVLTSWAVPRGPSLDPAVRRVAVPTEDHPLEYLDFEGVIPRGQYGAGDMIVWDTGTYRCTSGDPAEGLRRGELPVDLFGQKLQGHFRLVRTRTPPGQDERWLLLKKDDEHAVPGWEADDHPRSVLSGRTNDEVRHRPLPPPPVPSPDQRWHSPSQAQLDALDALVGGGTWHVDEVDVTLSNLDKVIFPPRDGGRALTKRDLVRHYALVAPYLLRYLFDRAVNLQRFPDGVEAKGFWQKNVPSNAPPWWEQWHDLDASPGRTEWYSVLTRPAALVWLANLATVEIHPWTSPMDAPSEPSWALIDIDPGPATTFDDVVVLARLFRSALDHLGVLGGPKTTGQRGLQIWIPVGPGHSYERTRSWVESLSRTVGALVPELISWEWRTADRGGRARLDYTQNRLHGTLVAPWSVRPAPGAPVSVPIGWEELDDPELRGDRWTIDDVPERLSRHGDPLAPLIGLRQELPDLGRP